MDTLNVVLLIVIGLMALVFVVLSGKVKSSTQKAASAEAERQAQEGKLNSLRQEVSALKEDSQRKAKALEEARENAKKKLRKDAQKGEQETETEILTGDSETERLKRSLAAMESQLRNFKDESLQATQAVRASVESEKSSEISKLNEKIEQLEEHLAQAKGESNKRRQNVSKQMVTPVDLTQLPPEVINELSRLFRKNEQHEKMHGILQGKYQLAQERYQELQRRYFAVCRELALVAAPQSEVSDEDAKRLAESVVEASDSLASEVKEAPETQTKDSSPEASH